jgi:four helix bundle protein
VYAVLERASVKHDVKFCDQMRDSARGGPRAIAEGFGRFRPADFARYLDYARGSLIETQNHLDDALDCRYLSLRSTPHSIDSPIEPSAQRPVSIAIFRAAQRGRTKNRKLEIQNPEPRTEEPRTPEPRNSGTLEP